MESQLVFIICISVLLYNDLLCQWLTVLLSMIFSVLVTFFFVLTKRKTWMEGILQVWGYGPSQDLGGEGTSLRQLVTLYPVRQQGVRNAAASSAPFSLFIQSRTPSPEMVPSLLINPLWKYSHRCEHVCLGDCKSCQDDSKGQHHKRLLYPSAWEMVSLAVTEPLMTLLFSMLQQTQKTAAPLWEC